MASYMHCVFYHNKKNQGDQQPWARWLGLLTVRVTVRTSGLTASWGPWISGSLDWDPPVGPLSRSCLKYVQAWQLVFWERRREDIWARDPQLSVSRHAGEGGRGCHPVAVATEVVLVVVAVVAVQRERHLEGTVLPKPISSQSSYFQLFLHLLFQSFLVPITSRSLGSPEVKNKVGHFSLFPTAA